MQEFSWGEPDEEVGAVFDPGSVELDMFNADLDHSNQSIDQPRPSSQGAEYAHSMEPIRSAEHLESRADSHSTPICFRRNESACKGCQHCSNYSKCVTFLDKMIELEISNYSSTTQRHQCHVLSLATDPRPLPGYMPGGMGTCCRCSERTHSIPSPAEGMTTVSQTYDLKDIEIELQSYIDSPTDPVGKVIIVFLR